MKSPCLGVRDGQTLVPRAQTGAARDRTFGFSQSDLRFWANGTLHDERLLCRHDERLLCRLALADGVGAGIFDGLIWRDGTLLSGRNKGWGVAVHDAQSGARRDFWEFPVAKITALCPDAAGGFWVTSGGGDGNRGIKRVRFDALRKESDFQKPLWGNGSTAK